MRNHQPITHDGVDFAQHARRVTPTDRQGTITLANGDCGAIVFHMQRSHG
ncbi:hypothetical protein HW090_08290 [Pseudomonas sp. ABC1]|nr:hypothetical protein [Pseudomonas sp. ABC1]QLF93189.1 hypothetical protein HW090_08290 [Pseudomonas sp. ABC1]